VSLLAGNNVVGVKEINASWAISNANDILLSLLSLVQVKGLSEAKVHVRAYLVFSQLRSDPKVALRILIVQSVALVV